MDTPLANMFLNVQEAADLLRVQKSTIYSWTSKKMIPFRKHGGKLVFCHPELLNWSLDKANFALEEPSEALEMAPGECYNTGTTSSLKTESTKHKSHRPLTLCDPFTEESE